MPGTVIPLYTGTIKHIALCKYKKNRGDGYGQQSPEELAVPVFSIWSAPRAPVRADMYGILGQDLERILRMSHIKNIAG